jgi:hypothetical protein
MWYRTSNRNRGFVSQIASKESRTWFYTTLQEELNKSQNPPASASSLLQPDPKDRGDVPNNPTDRYWLPKSAAVRDLPNWLSENKEDHALCVSVHPVSDIH